MSREKIVRSNPANKIIEEGGRAGATGTGADIPCSYGRDHGGEDISLQTMKDPMAEQGAM